MIYKVNTSYEMDLGCLLQTMAMVMLVFGVKSSGLPAFILQNSETAVSVTVGYWFRTHVTSVYRTRVTDIYCTYITQMTSTGNHGPDSGTCTGQSKDPRTQGIKLSAREGVSVFSPLHRRAVRGRGLSAAGSCYARAVAAARRRLMRYVWPAER